MAEYTFSNRFGLPPAPCKCATHAEACGPRWRPPSSAAAQWRLRTCANVTLQSTSHRSTCHGARNDENPRGRSAVEYAQQYLNNYVQLAAQELEERQAAGVESYNGPIGDFTRKSLAPDGLKATAARLSLPIWLPMMNELLVVASAFTTGVADDKTGFAIIGRTFCGAVESDYDRLAFARNAQPHGYFQPIIDLYHLWRPRLSRAELEEQSRQLKSQISTFRSSRTIEPV